MGEARRWAADACHELGRDDLVETAELGISELVTNALLHAAPPIAVRVRGTHRYPRIEVLDGSPEPPRINAAMAKEEELFSTFGRGLGMVAMCSHRWGADPDEPGKVVWFEPAAEPVDEPDLVGQVFKKPAKVRIAGPRRAGEGYTIVFAGFPVSVFLDWRRHFRELRRELRLLALAHHSDYPVAHTITELFERFDDEISTAHVDDSLAEAIAADQASADITMSIGPDTPALLGQVADVLDLADAFCRGERLLALAATPQQREFQTWFVGEVLRQSNGASPLPWLGKQGLEQRAR
ncbi:hypothetical protein BJ980_002627 [Nocardioides daedukensis]|uniref:Histidine kinase/HSP90-like ATPase domain-containing protein n=1 Tax=Nocardioides daedukensis TaxID=634462 RepID=A0A7Y9S2A4_9ACTN|nr:hypothetical protein [Nocardioides daedukensis]